MNEASFFQNIVKKKLLNDCFVNRLESVTSCGIPDVYFCRVDIDGWLELKSVKRVEEIANEIRQTQWNWWLQYLQTGRRNLFLAAKCGNKGRFLLYEIQHWDAVRDRKLDRIGVCHDLDSYLEEDVDIAREVMGL